MSYLFHRRKEFNEDIRNWDVSNVTNMCCMKKRNMRIKREFSTLITIILTTFDT